MTHRQSEVPRDWLIVDARLGEGWPSLVRKLSPGSGVLVLDHERSARERRKLLASIRRIARTKNLVIVTDDPGSSARVHSAREMRSALTGRTRLILLSPLYATRSHPEWKAMPRMRAAALARLAGRRLIALGGMNKRRFRTIQKLGFVGWAGIDAWIRT